ncbi:MAG TPA: efflux RND transporter periplasmic adaptor subunit [Gemmatimonadales bacterium]|nr:efflux RND transporter periplasmic adaptor subunit [Gemmatimonadales bacterium]
MRHAALSAVLAVLACACRKDAPPPRPTVPVTVARVEQRSVPQEISAIGTVTPIQTVAVRAQVSGTLVRVAFQEGDEVQPGQLLFQIDSRPFQAALDQALANLAKDRAQLVNARQEVSRYQQLVQNDLATQEQFDQFKANADAAAAAVTADSAAVQTARLNLEYTTIRAQIAGRTGSLLLREGNLVPINGATPLVVVNQIRPIAVSFSVPQKYLDDIQRFRAQGPLAVEIRPSDDTTAVLRGNLTFLNNQVDTTTGTIQLKATFANADRKLWPGEFVVVRLVLSVDRDALTIPSQAVMQGQNGTYVYLVTPDRSVRAQDVTVGRSAGDFVVIEKGLTTGQQVVTDGQLRLVPGARVEIKAGSDSGSGAAAGGGAVPGGGL